MKVKNTLKLIFFSIVAFIMICLLIIIGFPEKHDISVNNNFGYNILYKFDTCEEMLEKFYEDKDNIYYLPCCSSHAIYLEWDNGEVNLMIDDIKNNNVTIDSLISNGLNVHVEVRNE